MSARKYLRIVVEDNTINNGGKRIMVEIMMSDFDIQAVRLDAVRCMLLFCSNFRCEYTCISLTGLFKFIVSTVNGIMISKCPTMDCNGIMDLKFCIKNKIILNVDLLLPVFHYVLVSRNCPALMGFDIYN